MSTTCRYGNGQFYLPDIWQVDVFEFRLNDNVTCEYRQEEILRSGVHAGERSIFPTSVYYIN